MADSNNTDFDVMRHRTAEDDQDLLQGSHIECAIQEMKYHFRGKKSLSYITSGSLYNLSTIRSNQNMPDNEAFYMDSGAECLCNTNEGINFDKLDLPPTALRRPSALDQLRNSTSLYTPLY